MKSSTVPLSYSLVNRSLKKKNPSSGAVPNLPLFVSRRVLLFFF